MNILPNKELSESELYDLTNTFLDEGSEAHVYITGNYVAKIFVEKLGHKNITKEEVEEIKENKLKKLSLLYTMPDFDNVIKPIETYSYKGEFIGYKTIYVKYPVWMNLSKDNKDESIHYLKILKEKLCRYHNLGIIYGDIKDNNFFIDISHQDVILGDIDNMQVLDYPIDLMSYYTKDFVKSYGKVDEKLDSYTFNLMTIERLSSLPGYYCTVLENLEYGLVPRIIDIPQNKKLILEMSHITKHYSGNYLIDNL